MQKEYTTNIGSITEKNPYYRMVLHASTHLQLVLMSLNPKEIIPKEKHKDIDQFIRIESGTAHIVIGNNQYILNDGDCIIIPPDTYHEIQNLSDTQPLKLYSIYSSKVHKDNKIDISQVDD